MGIGFYILSAIVVAGMVTAIAVVVNIAMNRRKIDPLVGRMSFKESMDLVELPIVTFTNSGKKLNFLLDTGASYSVMNESVLKDIEYQFNGEKGSVFGIDGNKAEDSPYITASVCYGSRSYDEEFQVVDLSQAFGNIKEDFGVTLHGMLGSAFFQKYRYVLNFDELVAYSMV